MDADALALIPLHELKLEILRRCETVVIMTSTPGDGAAQVSWARQGDGYRVLGLIEEFKFVTLTELAVERRP